MALNHLTIPEMVDLIEDWATPGAAVRQALEQEPSLVGLIPTIEQTFARLLASQREPLALKASELALQRTHLDHRHDCLARVVYHILTGHIELARSSGDEATAARLTDVRDFLFPEGLSIINMSYRQEAGQARMLASRMTPDIEATLTSVPVAGGTLLDTVRTWLQVAADLGRLEDDFNAIQSPTNRVAMTPSRNAWMRTITGVRTIASLRDASEPLDPRIVDALDRIRLTEEAAARRLTDSPAPTPTDELPGDQPVEQPADDPVDDPVGDPDAPVLKPPVESAA